MPPTPAARLGMFFRRTRHWMRDVHWWAVLAVVAVIITVVLASTTASLEWVMTASLAAITLAILSLKER